MKQFIIEALCDGDTCAVCRLKHGTVVDEKDLPPFHKRKNSAFGVCRCVAKPVEIIKEASKPSVETLKGVPMRKSDKKMIASMFRMLAHLSCCLLQEDMDYKTEELLQAEKDLHELVDEINDWVDEE